MNNIFSETRLTLAEAAKRANKNTSTVHRWVHRGIKGVKLETAFNGGVRFTSEEAIQRFNLAIGERVDGPAPKRHKMPKRMREIEERRAERELDAAGV